MHELSIVMSLLEIVQKELKRHKVTKLLRVRVRYGALANVTPDAMEMAFTVMVTGTPLEGAVLELESVPLVVACGSCHREFTPIYPTLFIMTCPNCGEGFGHRVLSGKELYLDYLEAE